jgi:hypothetical protein
VVVNRGGCIVLMLVGAVEAAVVLLALWLLVWR